MKRFVGLGLECKGKHKGKEIRRRGEDTFTWALTKLQSGGITEDLMSTTMEAQGELEKEGFHSIA